MRLFQLRKATLLIGDILLLYGSLAATLFIRYGELSGDLWTQHVIPFTPIFFIWIVIFFINNLYSVQFLKNDFRFYGSLIQNLIVCLLIGFSFFYVIPESISSLKPFRVLLILIIVFTLLFLAWRRLFFLFVSSKTFLNNVLFLGVNDESKQLIDELKRKPHLGYHPAYVLFSPDQHYPNELNDISHSQDIAHLRAIIMQHRIQVIVAVGSSLHAAEASRLLFDIVPLGLAYYNFADFYERIAGKIPVASLEKTWFIENLLSGQRMWYEFFKRFQDIFFALAFGIISLPLLPLIMLAITTTSPGPILYTQMRTGRGGKAFRAMKFRSMVVDAETSGAQWATKNDPRVTRIGRILRKTRLDEIPQFINILKGDMSFVGPRPERPEFVGTLSQELPYYKERLLVKPGLTGWAQINFKYGESVADALTKLQYDLFYIKNRSFALDLSIVFKTIHTIFDKSLGQ